MSSRKQRLRMEWENHLREMREAEEKKEEEMACKKKTTKKTTKKKGTK